MRGRAGTVSMRWILWSLKGSDNLAWGEAPGDWAQRTREPCRGDIDFEKLHIRGASTPMAEGESRWSDRRLSSISPLQGSGFVGGRQPRAALRSALG